MAKRAFERFLPNVNDQDTSDSAYQQKRPLSVSVPPRSSTPRPRSTSAIKAAVLLLCSEQQAETRSLEHRPVEKTAQ